MALRMNVVYLSFMALPTNANGSLAHCALDGVGIFTYLERKYIDDDSYYQCI